MLLAADVFHSVVSSLEPDAAHAAREQRREPRCALETRLTILPCPQGLSAGLGPPLSVPVRDLSRGGLRFLLPRRLPLDTQFVALLPAGVGPAPAFKAPAVAPGAPALTTPGEPLAVLCTVTWWQPLARDLFALGAQFVRALAGFPLPEQSPRVALPTVVPNADAGQTVIGPAPEVAMPASPPAPPARRVAS